MSLIGKQRGKPITKKYFNNILNKFLVFLKREIKFNYNIPIVLIDDIEFSKKYKTFGMMMPDKIIISISNRHPIDILRTVSHEYIHHKQYFEGKRMDGSGGSKCENEANAKAGEIMRKYAKNHPEFFELTYIH